MRLETKAGYGRGRLAALLASYLLIYVCCSMTFVHIKEVCAAKMKNIYIKNKFLNKIFIKNGNKSKT